MTRRIGIEIELPVTGRDYFAAEFHDMKKLFDELILLGWHGKLDSATGALVGVKKEAAGGFDVVETDLGVCTLEVALAPAWSLQEAIDYWRQFKLDTLLPLTSSLEMRLLGYGNQPRSENLKHLIANKGHYKIFNTMFSEDVREWYLQNFPGLASVQFNFEIPATDSIKIINTLFALSPVIWAASNNDSIAGESLLPYKSQRYFAYKTLAGETLTDRYGSPRRSFKDLCEYICRMWDLPIFEIIREGEPLRPLDQCLTTTRLIQLESAAFIDLNNQIVEASVSLNDLSTAIYCSWLDFRLKINFHKDVDILELVRAVHECDLTSLMQFIERTLLEVRPISAQSHEQEIDWLIFMDLILDKIDDVAEYLSGWTLDEVSTTLLGAQKMGLRHMHRGKELGEIGLEVLNLIGDPQPDLSGQCLARIKRQLAERYSPGDAVAKIFKEDGLHAVLDYLTIRT